MRGYIAVAALAKANVKVSSAKWKTRFNILRHRGLLCEFSSRNPR